MEAPLRSRRWNASSAREGVRATLRSGRSLCAHPWRRRLHRDLRRPAIAEVEGLYRGETVDARFTRMNGCEIARWDRHAFLFPVKRESS